MRAESGDYFERIALISSIIAADIGALAIIGWLTGRISLASVISGSIPMAPNTAILFFLLGAALFVYIPWPQKPLTRRIAFTVSSFTIIFAGLTFITYYFPAEGFLIDNLLIPASGVLGEIPVGRMSPITAFCFMLSAISFFSLLRQIRILAAGLGSLILLIGFAILMGYWHDAPLFYSGSIIPMALPTAVSFLMLGISLLCITGPETWPLKVFTGPSTSSVLLRRIMPVVLGIIILQDWLTCAILGVRNQKAVFESIGLIIITLSLVYFIILETAKSSSREIDRLMEERRKALDALRASQEKYRIVVESMTDGVGWIDVKGMLIYANDRLCEIWGRSQKEILGHSPLDFLDDENKLIFKTQMEARRKGIAEPYEIEWIGKDGSKRVTIVSPKALFDLKGNFQGAFAVVTDITRRKKNERRIIQVEKLASIGQLSLGLAHGLNSPLMGLLNLTESYRDKTQAGSREYNELTQMLESIQHMAKIVHDLGAFTHKSQETEAELSLNEVIDLTLGFFQPRLLKEKIELIKDYAPELLLIRGAKNKLQQVILNIVSNAADAMPDGGQLTISTRNSEDDNNIVVEFIDTGTGIRKECLNKIFDPFFTTKEAGKGTGLGLSVSQSIISALKGSIRVESEFGKGAKFVILLPALKKEQENVPS